MQGPLIGQCTAKAEFEAQCDENLGLLHAAVEGMNDAVPLPRHRTQALEQLVRRAVSKLAAATAGSTQCATPREAARERTALASGPNSAASRWQWVSIQNVISVS